MSGDLFEPDAGIESQQYLAPGAVLLRGFATAESAALAADLRRVLARAPFRHMVTPGGLSMSVAMTNCGSYGWVSERTGYRYDAIDPESGKPWPPMPESFLKLAGEAAAAGAIALGAAGCATGVPWWNRASHFPPRWTQIVVCRD